MRRNHLLAVALSIGFASPVAAQSLSGKWITEFDRGMRNNDGQVSSTGEKAKARLTLAQKGDSVVGTWELVSPLPPNGAPPARQLRGTIAGDKVTLVSDGLVTVNRNGERSTLKMTTTYVFAARADALEGTMQMKLEEEGDQPARPFAAWREKP